MGDGNMNIVEDSTHRLLTSEYAIIALRLELSTCHVFLESSILYLYYMRYARALTCTNTLRNNLSLSSGHGNAHQKFESARARAQYVLTSQQSVTRTYARV